MNIIIANQQGILPNIGGIENVSYNLALEFIKKGHKVYFLSSFRPSMKPSYDSVIIQYYIPNVDSVESKIDFTHNIIIDHQINIVLNQSGDLKDFSEVLFESKKGTNCKIVSALHFNPLCKIMDVEDSYFVAEKLGRNFFYGERPYLDTLHINVYL